jgi:hypothetical protein
MTHVSRFPSAPGHPESGGYVVHSARLPDSPCRFSAWFTPTGRLYEAERIDRLGRSGPVGVLQRRALQRRFSYLAEAGQ